MIGVRGPVTLARRTGARHGARQPTSARALSLIERGVVERIRAFNRGREPERLALKYRVMRRSPFAFFRGTCHLFCEDWPAASPLHQAPLAWISGDLHLENFGCYRADNRLVYFDLNDFDEAVLAPATFEIARLLTSARLVARLDRFGSAPTMELSRRFLKRYRAALSNGKARWVERATSRGIVRALIQSAKRRTQTELLDTRTRRVEGGRRLRLGKRALPVSDSERAVLMKELRALGRTVDPRLGRVVDVARRVAGTGSLGLRRYILLVRGDATRPEMLLDLKEARPSALGPYLTVPQPDWASHAERVVTIQRWVQAVSPALLHAVRLGRTPFILRELQPTEDRLDLQDSRRSIRRLHRMVDTLGDVVAWAQLRNGGRRGSATIDDWVAFGGRKDWVPRVLRYARDYERTVVRDWKTFRQWDQTRRSTQGEQP